MNEQEEFFSPSHKQLLSIAVWAKYLAWAALVFYVLMVGLQIIQLIMAKDDGNFLGPTSQSLSTMLKHDPLEAFSRGINLTVTVLRGIIYYLVLKGISLGLNMIVETDINYREHKQEQVEQ